MNKTSYKTSFAPQHQQKVDELVGIAREQGFITYEEINDILPVAFDTADQIDQVLIYLSGMDIQILNQSEVDRQALVRPHGSCEPSTSHRVPASRRR